MTKKMLAAALVSGLVFAIGLGVSGMTQPSRVIGFLDLFDGHWDPSLALVMAGAIAVHMPLYRWIRARPNALTQVGTCGPISDEQTEAGARGSTSGAIIAGAAIFGVGWGLGGYCPGPAVVSLISAGPGVAVFVIAMLAGMVGFNLLFAATASPSSAASPSTLASGQERG
jgi:uncharacterized membrane protein YedE/YeeE